MHKVMNWRGAPARLAAAAACSVFLLGPALAGPVEDTALAETEFARGNLVVSMELWTKAANAGHAPAQARLGDILDKSEEDADAFAWYGKAAAQGDAAGQFGLGQMYAKGEGVERNLEQARTYVQRSAEQNYLPALQMLAGAYRTGGLGLPADPQQAAAWDAKIKLILPTYGEVAPQPVVKGKKARKARLAAEQSK